MSIKDYINNYIDYENDDSLLEVVYKTRNNLVNLDFDKLTYTLPIATSSVLGGVKSTTTGTTSNRYYYVEVQSNGTMRVNVPWTDTNTHLAYPVGFSSRNTSPSWGMLTTANGYTYKTDWVDGSGGDIGFWDKSGQLYVQIDGFFYQNEGSYRVLDELSIKDYAGSGLTFSDNKFVVNTSYETSGYNYKVAVASTGGLYVNVPWVNTTYTFTQPATNQIKITNIQSGNSTTLIINNVANATTASRIGSSTIGSETNPIYISAGTPTKSSTTVGSSSVPVYLNNGVITTAGNVNADTIDNFHMLNVSMAYKSYLKLEWGGATSLLEGTKTYAEIIALNNVAVGVIFYASDTSKYYKSIKNTSTASASNWTECTSGYNNSLTLTNQQTKTQDYVYVKITTNSEYYQNMIKFWVSSSYDNINGTNEIDGYCRTTNEFYINSVSYNGNNLLGIYQASDKTDVYYLKLRKYTSAITSDTNFKGDVIVYCNVDLKSLEFIDESDSTYANVKAYSYISVPTSGIHTTSLWQELVPYSTNTYDLGTSSKRWRYLYAQYLNISGTCTFSGDVSGLVFTGTKATLTGTYYDTTYTANTTTLSVIDTNTNITASKATAGTAITYGNANVGTSTSVVNSITFVEPSLHEDTTEPEDGYDFLTTYIDSYTKGSLTTTTQNAITSITSGSLTSDTTSTNGIVYVSDISMGSLYKTTKSVSIVGTYNSSSKNLTISLGGTQTFMSDVSLGTSQISKKYLHYTSAKSGSTQSVIKTISYTAPTLTYNNQYIYLESCSLSYTTTNITPAVASSSKLTPYTFTDVVASKITTKNATVATNITSKSNSNSISIFYTPQGTVK